MAPKGQAPVAAAVTSTITRSGSSGAVARGGAPAAAVGGSSRFQHPAVPVQIVQDVPQQLVLRQGLSHTWSRSSAGWRRGAVMITTYLQTWHCWPLHNRACCCVAMHAKPFPCGHAHVHVQHPGDVGWRHASHKLQASAAAMPHLADVVQQAAEGGEAATAPGDAAQGSRQLHGHLRLHV